MQKLIKQHILKKKYNCCNVIFGKPVSSQKPLLVLYQLYKSLWEPKTAVNFHQNSLTIYNVNTNL